MRTMTTAEIAACIHSIVHTFGDGTFDKDKYLFDQITKLPSGCNYRRIAVPEAFASITGTEFYLLIDPKPQNTLGSTEVAKRLSLTMSDGFEVSRAKAIDALGVLDCDMYILSTGYDLLIAACHEDDVIDGNRIIWMPLRSECSES